MAQVNHNNSAPSVSAADILRALNRIEAIEQQLDGVKSELRAMLPSWKDQATAQKVRNICSSRAMMRAYRDGKVQL
jgi:hypothetical protein